MRILYLTYYFAPKNEIGAVRTSKIAKYLIRKGHEVDIVTYGSNPYQELESKIDETLMCNELNESNIIRIPFPNLLKSLYKFKSNNNRSFANSANIDGKGTFLKSIISFLKLVIQTTLLVSSGKRLKLDSKKYDVIISSYGPYCMIDLGIYYAKKFPEAIFVQDIRDDVIYLEDRKKILIYNYKKNMEKRMLKYADCIFIVSEEAHGFYRQYIPTYLISNGYDKDDFEDSTVDLDKNLIHFYYGGRVYQKQDLSLLAKVIKEYSLIDKVRVHYAGKDFERFCRSFEFEGVIDCVINHGFLSRYDSMKLQRSVTIQILLTWNNQDEKGMITGKVFELINSNKPILCLVNGNIPNCAVEKMFSSSSIRKCFYNYKSSEVDSIKVFIDYIKGLESNEMENIIINEKEIFEQYEYSHIVDKVIEYLDNELLKV